MCGQRCCGGGERGQGSEKRGTGGLSGRLEVFQENTDTEVHMSAPRTASTPGSCGNRPGLPEGPVPSELLANSWCSKLLMFFFLFTSLSANTISSPSEH